MIQDTLSKLKELVSNSSPDGIPTRVKHTPDLYKAVIDWCDELKCSTLSEKIYLFINQIPSVPVCECGNILTFRGIVKGYAEFCKDRRCVHARKAATDRRVESLIKSGGVGLANPKTKKKAEETLQDRFGIKNPFQLPSVVEFRLNNNPMHDTEVVEKIRSNCKKQHGVDWHLKRHDVRAKTIETTNQKYGVDNGSQKHYSDQTLTILTDYNKMKDMYLKSSISEMAQSLTVCETTILKYLRFLNIRQPNEISPEVQIQNFLMSLGLKDFKKTRTVLDDQQELDLYSTDYNVAIEYCGLYWHSEKYKNRNYHHKKYKQCTDKGIRLITIFEDEWLNYREVVQNRLSHLFNKNTHGIGARSLSVIELDRNSSEHFFNKYHVGGYTQAKICYAAIDKNGYIRAVMSFGKNRKIVKPTIDWEWEMVRFATDGGHYPGVAAKLFSRFVKDFNPISVLSYSDLRWGEGNYLKNLGFTRYEDTPPNYWYFSLKNAEWKRYHRFLFNKQSLIKKFPELVRGNSTEYSIAKEAGLERIWDCGNAKWIWHKK